MENKTKNFDGYLSPHFVGRPLCAYCSGPDCHLCKERQAAQDALMRQPEPTLQTLLPYSDFRLSAMSLDRMRLGLQRSQTFEILSALLTGIGRTAEPAVMMWRRYEWALLQYQRDICEEWVGRGYKDTYLERTLDLYDTKLNFPETREWPNWLGQQRFHLSHRSNLMRKDRAYYGGQFAGTPDHMDYVWPTLDEELRALGPTPWWNLPGSDGVPPF